MSMVQRHAQCLAAETDGKDANSPAAVSESRTIGTIACATRARPILVLETIWILADLGSGTSLVHKGRTSRIQEFPGVIRQVERWVPVAHWQAAALNC